MSSYYNYNHHQQPTAPAPGLSHNHHGGRNRRAPRLSVSQNSHRQFRGVKSMKELSETAGVTAFRNQFEASRSFDLEDDMEFCPKLLSETDLVSISSASSDRSSLSSNSPNVSPTQHTQQIASTFSLNSSSPAFVPPTFQSHQSSLKLHQPAATRARNAIPIINPANGLTMSSPPPSVSPGRMHQHHQHQHPIGRRW
ncbi:Uu.00g063450.m01.CDS01 [Anthostomella pinea]|uniref:Uu.00g063450.m01.CDS01 n=1 Tax=Anthostomella pinea TaxID=933095 RepID=A0AAI8VTZ7_9PEZI|nr:Uu.00g063450.m01.CDS01 [Anthostomella pinea]